MTHKINKDYIHTYQPISFTDLGKDEDSKSGYDWETGRVLVSRQAKSGLLKKLPGADVSPLAKQFRKDVEREASWSIFEHLNAPLGKAEEGDQAEAYDLLLGNVDNFQETLDMAMNLALYTGKRSGNPGLWRGNSILLGQLRDPNSVAYNMGRPDFKKRIVNGAFWEQIEAGLSRELETILSQEAPCLDPSSQEIGWKILKKNTEGTVGFPHIGFDFRGLSKGAMTNFAYFVSGVEKSDIDLRYKNQFQKIFVTDYVEALEDQDCWGTPYFEEKERKYLRELVSD